MLHMVLEKQKFQILFLEYKGKNYRVRVETLIYNDQGMLYIGKRTDTTNKDGVYYDIPGGSVEPGKDLEEQG